MADWIWRVSDCFRSDGDDAGFWVTTSPDGSRAYVVGDSTGTTGSFDFITLAYRVLRVERP